MKRRSWSDLMVFIRDVWRSGGVAYFRRWKRLRFMFAAAPKLELGFNLRVCKKWDHPRLEITLFMFDFAVDLLPDVSDLPF